MSKPKGFGTNQKSIPKINSPLKNDEIEILKIIRTLEKNHDEVTEFMIEKAHSELKKMEVQGEIFKLAMSGEIDFRLNENNKLEFGSKNQA